MSNYIDGYAFPIGKEHLNEYRKIGTEVAKIWKEHGALAYVESIGEDLQIDGLLGFPQVIDLNENETVVFGWIEFESREARDVAHEKVRTDPRMEDLIAPLINSERKVFDASRMVYGGFDALIRV